MDQSSQLDPSEMLAGGRSLEEKGLLERSALSSQLTLLVPSGLPDR